MFVLILYLVFCLSYLFVNILLTFCKSTFLYYYVICNRLTDYEQCICRNVVNKLLYYNDIFETN